MYSNVLEVFKSGYSQLLRTANERGIETDLSSERTAKLWILVNLDKQLAIYFLPVTGNKFPCFAKYFASRCWKSVLD